MDGLVPNMRTSMLKTGGLALLRCIILHQHRSSPCRLKTRILLVQSELIEVMGKPLSYIVVGTNLAGFRRTGVNIPRFFQTTRITLPTFRKQSQL